MLVKLRTSLLGSRKAIVRDFFTCCECDLTSIAIAQNRGNASGCDQARIPALLLGNGQYSTWKSACCLAAPAFGSCYVRRATKA